jgi:hypothetical protein
MKALYPTKVVNRPPDWVIDMRRRSRKKFRLKNKSRKPKDSK